MPTSCTTSRMGFRVEDITFHSARKQNDILNEIPKDNSNDFEPEVPVSTTPEQIISYFNTIIDTTSDNNKKRIFTQAVRWIKEMGDLRKELISYKLKEMKHENIEETPDDIQSDQREENKCLLMQNLNFQ